MRNKFYTTGYKSGLNFSPTKNNIDSLKRAVEDIKKTITNAQAESVLYWLGYMDAMRMRGYDPTFYAG